MSSKGKSKAVAKSTWSTKKAEEAARDRKFINANRANGYRNVVGATRVFNSSRNKNAANELYIFDYNREPIRLSGTKANIEEALRNSKTYDDAQIKEILKEYTYNRTDWLSAMEDVKGNKEAKPGGRAAFLADLIRAELPVGRRTRNALPTESIEPLVELYTAVKKNEIKVQGKSKSKSRSKTRQAFADKFKALDSSHGIIVTTIDDTGFGTKTVKRAAHRGAGVNTADVEGKHLYFTDVNQLETALSQLDPNWKTKYANVLTKARRSITQRAGTGAAKEMREQARGRSKSRSRSPSKSRSKSRSASPSPRSSTSKSRSKSPAKRAPSATRKASAGTLARGAAQKPPGGRTVRKA